MVNMQCDESEQWGKRGKHSQGGERVVHEEVRSKLGKKREREPGDRRLWLVGKEQWCEDLSGRAMKAVH